MRQVAQEMKERMANMVMTQEEQIEVLRAETRVLAQDFDAMLEETQRWDVQPPKTFGPNA
jgi:hypothetical protein